MNAKKSRPKCHPSNSTLGEIKDLIPHNFLEKLMINCERVRVFDPVTTLFCMLQQALRNGSCKEAISILNTTKIRDGMKCASMNTGAFCRAKLKIPISFLRNLFTYMGNENESQCGNWKWHGRNIKLVDGTTLQMEDSKENQKMFPQNVSQKEGLGQPIMRLLGVFGCASGSLLDLEYAPYSGKGTGEPSLLRKLISRLERGDVLILDRFFSNYFLHRDLEKQGVDFLVRARDQWAERYLRGNEKDKLIVIKRPQKSSYVYEEDYYSYPQQAQLRLIKSVIVRKGFRIKKIYLVTSLVNYKRKDVEELYGQRWNVELDFRNLKRTLGAFFLKCKTPEMVMRELYVKILAHNLVRALLIKTARLAKKRPPRKFSFKVAIILFNNLVIPWGKKGANQLIKLLQTEKLNRKYRWEPRAIKKRGRGSYQLLTVSRNQAKLQREGGYAFY